MSRNKQLDVTDKQLIEGCIRGIAKYQEMLYRRFFSFAMSISVRYTPSQAEAMTVANDSFLKAFSSIADYNPERPFKSWFGRIVVNAAIDSFRRGRRLLQLAPTDGYPILEEADTSTINDLTAEDILKLFDELPDTYRLTFNLYEIEGYTHDEIADMLGTTPATSRANLSRAKQKLRALYCKHFNEARRHYEAI